MIHRNITPPSVPHTSFMDHPRPDQEQTFSLMGEQVLFQTNDSRLMEAARQAFGRFPPPQESSTPPLTIRLFTHTPEPRAEPESTGRPRPIYHTQGHLFSIHIGADIHAIADLAQGFAYGFVSHATANDLPYVRYNIIESLGLVMLGVSRGYFVVHAACVVKDGVSLLLYGGSGAGKSTLAYACVRRGYKLLSEDAVQVKACQPEPQLWGMPWKFHLLPDAKQYFPELELYATRLQMSGKWKLEIDLEAINPGSTITQTKPGKVVLLKRAGKGKEYDRPPTRIHRLNRSKALETFRIVWQWEVGWNEQLDKATSQLLDGGVYCLMMNGSPEEAVDALDGILVDR